MRRKIFSTLFTVVGASAILLGAQTAAHAEWTDHSTGGESGYSVVGQDTATGSCLAYVLPGEISFAYGKFENRNSGFSCTGWLEQSVHYGTYKRVSAYHTTIDNNSVDQALTNDYRSDDPYRVRACFHLNFSGAATHCSPAF